MPQVLLKLKITAFYYFTQRSTRQTRLTCFWNKIKTLLTFYSCFCVLTLLYLHVASFLCCNQFCLLFSSSLQYWTKVAICWPGMIRVKFGSNPSISFFIYKYKYIFILTVYLFVFLDYYKKLVHGPQGSWYYFAIFFMY